MIRRLTLTTLTLFWGVMIYLLWNAEYGSGNSLGSSLPVATVWRRVLTAPDDSSLVIFQKDRRAGICRWSANVGQDFATGKAATLDQQTEGRIMAVTHYTIDFDGTFYPDQSPLAYRFDTSLRFSTNQAWEEFSTRITQRPSAWELKADALKQTLALTANDGDASWTRQFTFEELRSPEKILAELGMPWAMGLIGSALGTSPRSAALPQLSLGLKWEARYDQLKLGKTGLPCYRLSARLFDKFAIVIYISRVGEILRVELPNDLVLMNEGFLNL